MAANAPPDGKTTDRPNLVWILLDACRAENLSCYGYDRKTSPTIDRLAQHGVLFENAFSQGVWTNLAVASYMTGKYFPVVCFDFGLGLNVPREVPPDEKLLPEILKANGYHTVLVTAHAYMSPRSRLYKAFDESSLVAPSDRAVADFEALNRVVLPKISQIRNRPFFLYIHALDTHFPHVLKPPYDSWVEPGYASRCIRNGQPVEKTGLRFTEEDKRQLRGMHDGAIMEADAGVGRIEAELQRQGLMDKTLIVITADHGDALGEDGTTWGHQSSPDQVIRIPLILCGPGLPQGKRITQCVENTDFVPTLVGLLELTTDARFDGRSFLPLLHAQSPLPIHDYTFTRWAPNGYDRPQTYILRDATYKYEYDSKTGQERLYRVPDNVARRIECTAEAKDALELFRARVRADIQPRWDAYDRQRRLYAEFFFTSDILKDSVTPTGAIVQLDGQTPTETQCADNAWSCLNEVLWAAPWAEDVPAIQVRGGVPPGRYVVTVFLFGVHDLLGHPASSIQVSVNDDDFRAINSRPNAGQREQDLWQDLGTYDMPDGVFRAVIATGEKDCWATIRGFRLTLVQAYGEPRSANDTNLQDQLHALGYF